MVEKRKLVPIKSMVSVKSSTQSLNFIGITGIDIDQFPDKSTVHLTINDKDGYPMTVKDICTQDHQHVQDLQDQGCNVEIIWGKRQALLTQQPEIKVYSAQCRTHTHFKKYLTQDQIIQYIQDGHVFGFCRM